MSLRSECAKMIRQIWDLNDPKQRHVYLRWTESHIGVQFKYAGYEALKTLHYILKYKLEHGKCPFHHIHGNDKVRRQRLGPGWESLRAKIIQERGPHCENPGCGKRNLVGADLTVDHIIPVFQGGASTRKNLQILCLKCHAEKGKKNREGSKSWKKFRKEQLPQRVAEIKAMTKWPNQSNQLPASALSPMICAPVQTAKIEGEDQGNILATSEIMKT